MELNKNNLPDIQDIPSTRIKDLTNQIFGRLKVIGYVGNNKHHKSMWLCKCSCENQTYKIVEGSELSRGNTVSCGCYAIDVTRKRSITHGMSKTRIHRIWSGMHERCYNENGKDYDKYGGKGISICQEWLRKNDGFLNFYNWAINNGYKENLSIDRIEVNGNYEPNNCRWVTVKIQNCNKTTTSTLLYNGKEEKTFYFHKKMKSIVNYDTFKQRLDSNWDVDEALYIPSGISRQKYYFLKNLEEELILNKNEIHKQYLKDEYNIKNDTFNLWIKSKEVNNLLDKYGYINKRIKIIKQ